MKKAHRPTLQIAVKYGLLQLPGQAAFALMLVFLRQWLEIPAAVTWGLVGCWVGKDILMFPFLWRYYDPDYYSDRFKMTGRKGFTMTRLQPDGYVRVQAERWRAAAAEKNAPIEKGEPVLVVGVEGLKLTVRACSEEQPR